MCTKYWWGWFPTCLDPARPGLARRLAGLRRSPPHGLGPFASIGGMRAEHTLGLGQIVYLDHRHASRSIPFGGRRAVGVIDVQMLGGEPFTNLAERAVLLINFGKQDI